MLDGTQLRQLQRQLRLEPLTGDQGPQVYLKAVYVVTEGSDQSRDLTDCVTREEYRRIRCAWSHGMSHPEPLP